MNNYCTNIRLSIARLGPMKTFQNISYCSVNALFLTILRTGAGQMGVHEQSYSCPKPAGRIPVLRPEAWSALHGNKKTVPDKIHHDGVQLVPSRLQR